MIKKVTKEIRVCDVCGRENNYLQKCIVCGKEYCSMCNSVIAGCMVSVDCCKECAKREDVLEIVKEYALPLVKLKNERDEKLQALLPN